MANKFINQFDELVSLAAGDQFLVFDISTSTTYKTPVSAVAALVSGATGETVTASAVASAGAIMSSYFTATSGYMRKESTGTYSATPTIPSTDVSGIFTEASADSKYAFDTSISTVGKSNSYNDLDNLPTLFTEASADAKYSTVSTIDNLTDVSTVSAATSQYLMYNGSQWIPTSIASGGAATSAQMAKVKVGLPIVSVLPSTQTTVVGGSVDGLIGSNVGSWDSVNGRFTPNIAGKYEVNWRAHMQLTSAATSARSCQLILQKNGSVSGISYQFEAGVRTWSVPSAPTNARYPIVLRDVVVVNGTSDYINTVVLADTTMRCETEFFTVNYLGS
jgi:hypothetical protein